MLRWPDDGAVREAVRAWASRTGQQEGVARIGYFGSYARGDWGVGSDIDVVVIVDTATAPFEQRSLSWDTSELPLQADVLVYTVDEWNREGLDRIKSEVVWEYER